MGVTLCESRQTSTPTNDGHHYRRRSRLLRHRKTIKQAGVIIPSAFASDLGWISPVYRNSFEQSSSENARVTPFTIQRLERLLEFPDSAFSEASTHARAADGADMIA